MEDSDFIYLVPGNWFEIKNLVMDKTYPYDMEAFKNEVINQVTNRSEMLSLINMSFGNKYTKNSIDDIEFYLDEEKFMKIASLLKSETRHPIITFHGTSEVAVNSIVEKGYIVPGKNGVKVKNGSMYGNGVYTSPFFDKAMYYTLPDKISYVYVLVNILLLGKLKMVAPNSGTSGFKLGNGIYSDGCHTRIVFGLEQIVSADANRVIPVAVMKIKVN